jgi:hypothetical protein
MNDLLGQWVRESRIISGDPNGHTNGAVQPIVSNRSPEGCHCRGTPGLGKKKAMAQLQLLYQKKAKQCQTSKQSCVRKIVHCLYWVVTLQLTTVKGKHMECDNCQGNQPDSQIVILHSDLSCSQGLALHSYVYTSKKMFWICFA